MTLDFAIDLPHPPYIFDYYIKNRSSFRYVVREDTRRRYADEMFYYFNNVFNIYCQRHRCYYFTKQYVKKGYV